MDLERFVGDKRQYEDPNMDGQPPEKRRMPPQMQAKYASADPFVKHTSHLRMSLVSC